MAEYVYGIVEAASSPPDRAGIGDAPIRVIAGDGAAALVSDLPGDVLELGPRDLLTHSSVLTDALDGGTVLPMRFGVVMDGADEVRRDLLESHADMFRTQLDRFEGMVEYSLRVVYEEQALIKEIVGGDREIASLRDAVRGKPEEATYFDRITLGQLVAEAVARKRDADALELLDSLTRTAEAVEVGEPVHERMVLSASFLLSREQQRRFDDLLERLARERSDRMRFKLTGPLPPHSFVELDGDE
jgi:Gas vesicle synthesis protein GvpL/GvpF